MADVVPALAFAAPTYNILYQVCALFTCMAGSHAALLLAAATIRLRLPKLMVLTALQFCIQSIFTLHFLGMCGMGFGVPWGFDIILTLASLAVVALAGTGAVTLALRLRQDLQPAIEADFGFEDAPPSFGLYGRLLVYILGRAPTLQAIAAVLLMAVGAAGCHHLGMWSIQGTGPQQIAATMNFWSLVTTVLVGGVVSVLAILTFLVVPEGWPGVVAAAVLTVGIGAFHWGSAAWGMEFVVGAEGMTSHVVLGSETIMVLVVAQGAVSQIITGVFSRMAVANHTVTQKQLRVAQTLGQYIATMDLEPAKAIQYQALNPSALEMTLFQIVGNLELYRPFLPDTLFQPNDGGDSDAGEEKSLVDDDDATERSHTSGPGTGTPHRHPTTLKSHHRSAEISSTLHGAARYVHSSSESEISSKKAHKQRSRNMALGLKPSRLVVLRIRLQGLNFFGKLLNGDAVEDHLQRFLQLVTAEVRNKGGTVVACSGGAVLAMWASITLDTAVECAISILHQSDRPLTMVLQCGHFLCGNLGAEHIQAFNVVGPGEWAGQQLLRVGLGHSHLLITTKEWDSLHYKYQCLPYERVVVEGAPVTVYSVVAPAAKADPETDCEWMYQVDGNLHIQCMAGVEELWEAYCGGQYDKARAHFATLTGLPLWYPLHLLTLLEHAAKHKAALPVKSLEALGWHASPVTDL